MTEFIVRALGEDEQELIVDLDIVDGEDDLVRSLFNQINETPTKGAAPGVKLEIEWRNTPE